MNHNKLIEESEKIFNDSLKEGSGFYADKRSEEYARLKAAGKHKEAAALQARHTAQNKKEAKDRKALHASDEEAGKSSTNGKALKEGSGGEQSQLRRIDAEDNKNPATNPVLKRLERKLKHKQEGADRRARHRGMLVIPKKDREPKDLKQRLQQRQTMRQARPVKTVGEKLPK